MLGFTLEVKGTFQSQDLWSLIKPYKANLIDTGDHVYVWGNASIETLSMIISACVQFGQLSGDIYLSKGVIA